VIPRGVGNSEGSWVEAFTCWTGGAEQLTAAWLPGLLLELQLATKMAAVAVSNTRVRRRSITDGENTLEY
jgi:hypothetical protein